MYVYIVTNAINGKEYIGQTVVSVDHRWEQHKQRGHALFKAIKKYGESVFKVAVLDEASSVEELNEKETAWIGRMNTIAPNGYNLRIGGDSGGRHSSTTKERISVACRGRRVSKETRAIKRAQMSGENNPQFGKTGELSPNFGKKPSKETCEKISRANTGKRHSRATLDKLSRALMGRKGWREGKKFGRESGRRNQRPFSVFLKASGEYVGTWSNQRQCSEDLGIIYQGIHTVLSGRRPSYKGYVFKKLND